MAHTYSYEYVGSIESEQKGVRKHIVQGQITVSTDVGDAYSRTTGLVFTFPQITTIIEVIGLFTDIVSNTGMLPVYSAISGNTLTVKLLESGPNVQGPLREKAEEVHDQEYNFYAVVAGI